MRILRIFASQYFWLSLIIFLGFLVRLYKIDAPIADWHSWRQADTAAVTRNFVKDGLHPLFTYYDDMSGVAEKAVPNGNTYRFVEFPVYNMAVYPFYKFFGVLELWHRLVSVLFSLGSSVFLFLILGKYLDARSRLLSVAVFTFLPFNVFFSRTTLPEPAFLFFALGMMYFVDKWIGAGRGVWGTLGFIFTALAFLIKPWAIFFFLPLLYSVWTKRNTKKFWLKFLIWTLAALLPFLMWRLWILQQPQGIPASDWLFNGDGIRFRPAFWWWIVSERLGREILGVTGFALLIVGLIVRPKVGNYFLHFWLLSVIVYMIVIATGNVRHNYYQVLTIAPLSVFVAKGFTDLIRGGGLLIPRIFTILIALFLLPLSFYFGWTQVKEFYKINNPAIVQAGRAADGILPKDAVVIAPYNGDTAFLYQTNRKGWAFVTSSIKDMIADFGVTGFVTVNKDAKTAWVKRHFRLYEETPEFVIADLTQPLSNLDDSDIEP